MKRIIFWVLIAGFIGVTIPVGADWRDDFQTLITGTKDADTEILIGKIIDVKPQWREIQNAFRSVAFESPESTDMFLEFEYMCSDGVKRPYILYVPPDYDALEPVPLLVYLHGGVSRKDILEERLEYAQENPFIAQARLQNWLVFFPFGQLEATWWDDVGMDNVLGTIRHIKQQYNIDDDRVWMTGFSDGGSASFLFSMVHPTDFAAFAPLNGHMGVGALDGELPTYVTNMTNTPLYVINTDVDALYPAAKMRQMIDMATNAGADILYREYNGIGHDFAYADVEMPLISRFFERHPRDPFPGKIIWKSAFSDFGRCRWIEIEAVSPEPPASWHEDANLVLTDTRITFGFFMDDKFEGKGIRVNSLVEGDTPARAMDLRVGDIIVKCNDTPIRKNDDLDAFKSTICRGDSIKITVSRDGEKVKLSGTLPEPVHYYLFPRSVPSAAVKAEYSANRIDIKSSRVERLTVYIHPDMIQLDQPLSITVDGVEVFNGIVTPDIEFMLRNYLENRDRRQLFINKLTIEMSNF